MKSLNWVLAIDCIGGGGGGGGVQGSRGRNLGVCGLYFQYTFGDIYFEHDRDCMFWVHQIFPVLRSR